MNARICCRTGCENRSCNRYSDKFGYGYICEDCFKELVDAETIKTLTHMEVWLRSSKGKIDKKLVTAYYDAIFPEIGSVKSN